MSRSVKQPYVSNCVISEGDMKWWKRQCNGKIRRIPIDEDIGYYKKHTNRWTAPDDGRHYWDDPKARRK